MGAIDFLNEAGKQYGTLLGKLVPVKAAYKDLKKVSNKMTDKANANRNENNAFTLGYGGKEIDGTGAAVKPTAIPQELHDAIAKENKQAMSDPKLAPLSQDFKMGDQQYRESNAGVGGFSAMTPMTASGGGGQLGRDHSKSMIYTNLGRTPLEQELANRDGIGYAKSGGNTSFIGGKPMDPAKIKMLENIGMVKKGSMNKMDAPALSQASASVNSPAAPQAMQLDHGVGSIGVSTAPQSRRLDSPIIYNGQEEGNGPKHIRVGAPSKGFFDSLGKYSSAVRQNKQAIAADKFDRKQTLEEDLGRSEMAYRQKRTDLYDDIQLAGINKKNAEANRTDGLAILDPTKVNAEAAKNIGRGNYYNSFAGKLDAEAAEVAADHAIERDLNAAKAGNYEALMKLNNENALAVPIRLRADVQNTLAQAGLRQAQTGLTNANTKEVAANAQVDRAVKTSKANAYVKDIAGKYNLNEARAREIVNSEPYQTLLMQQRALQAQASAGNQQATAELKQVEIEMSRMFMQQ